MKLIFISSSKKDSLARIINHVANHYLNLRW